ncbi:MAG: hypothetical protein IPJ90_11625 [Anaerolineaceae bacterium]|nr:hypothetical protein [Anaerolineaceae bacterium]
MIGSPLNSTFNFVASQDDVEFGKPDPEIYQLMAGMAGMAVIAVKSPFSVEPSVSNS